MQRGHHLYAPCISWDGALCLCRHGRIALYQSFGCYFQKKRDDNLNGTVQEF